MFSGKLPGGLSLSAQPLSVGGWPLLRGLLQSVSNLFLGAPGSFGMVPAYQSVGWTSLGTIVAGPVSAPWYYTLLMGVPGLGLTALVRHVFHVHTGTQT